MDDLVREFWQSAAGKYMLSRLYELQVRWEARTLATSRQPDAELAQIRYEAGVSAGIALVLDALRKASRLHAN